MEKVVFLDRDGVISRDSPNHIKSWDEFHFLPRSKDAIKLLTNNGFNIIVITNQSVIARKMVTKKELEEMHNKMKNEIKKHGGKIVNIYYCPHHPNDGCNCRKPKTGLFKKAMKENSIDVSKSYMVGDRIMDVLAGKTIGCKTVIIPSELGLEELKESNTNPDYIAKDLFDAAEWIITNYNS
jgi:histidinol-phosphate phosphatase family protein